ncbi:hypothetical protein PF003_g826 [Phytophthora fragariae]|nr:hypothetical protein PF003_g826 [Phytophthora fragariae]
MTTGRVVFVLARVWGVPVRHGDVPNANVKAKKEEHLEILMHIPQGMVIGVARLTQLGVKDKGSSHSGCCTARS